MTYSRLARWCAASVMRFDGLLTRRVRRLLAVAATVATLWTVSVWTDSPAAGPSSYSSDNYTPSAKLRSLGLEAAWRPDSHKIDGALGVHATTADDATVRNGPALPNDVYGLRETSPDSLIWHAGLAANSSFSADALATLRGVFEWITTPTARCSNLTRLGGVGGDGDKAVCLDRPLTFGGARCLVYSIGVNNEWSFDVAAAALGCDVHSFDPSMPDQPEGRVRPGITFHRLGIGRNNHTNERGWPVLVLDHLIAALGHKHRAIQYLKVDAEGGELDMLIDQLVDVKSMHRMFVLDRVEQIGLEVHLRLFPERELTFYGEVLAALRQLTRLGFDLVDSHPNRLVPWLYVFPGVPHAVSLMYELLLVRRRPAHPQFDKRVQYPCGELCDLVDRRPDRMLRRLMGGRVARRAAPPVD